MIRGIVALILGVSSIALADDLKLPSSVNLGVTVDEDKNAIYSIDAIAGLSGHWQFEGGFSTARLDFDDGNTFRTRTGYLGIATNPVKDISYRLNLTRSIPSEFIVITEVSAAISFYAGKFNFYVEPGVRRIYVDLLQVFQTSEEALDDVSPFWTLDISYMATHRLAFRTYFTDFYYEENLKPFTRQFAVTVGYDAATVNQSQSMVDYRSGIAAIYSWRKYSLGIDVNHSDYAFIDSSSQNITLQMGYQMKNGWFFSVSPGITLSDLEGESASSGFATINLSKSW